ncbi:uncharacterized protein LOC133890395 [Phragmites australis]|uniref:uncharacterized protein LOC133890395 n=1 Tax=Phragmites australis TaxID=29695 RepID=UPI002D76635C|nr:uncharacterized protein LOC133890395 [Phragmites australis]
MLNVDSMSTIALIKNPVFHDRSKHIDTRFYFIRECVDRGKIILGYTRTEDQLADILTKPLGSVKFMEQCAKIGVEIPGELGTGDRQAILTRRRGCKAAGRWKATASGKKLLRLRLRLMRLVFLVPARRVVALFAELVRRLSMAASAVDAAADCPAIVLSSQWGLPVLYHSASTGWNARLRAFYLERSLSAGGSGTGSPC